MSSGRQSLVRVLRVIGLFDLTAIVAVFAPHAWIDECHRFLGLGDFPTAPIAMYLARSTSLWYALFGLMLWYLSCDVQKYSSLISAVAWAMIVQGLVYLGIDVVENLPGWWIFVEGPSCSALGALILWQQRDVSSPRD